MAGRAEMERHAMHTDMLWINEGFVQDDAGNLMLTSYVDLRHPASRTPVRTLVKACRREHALEDTKTIQLSAVQTFREDGENLIRDHQEGLAKEVLETIKPETPEQALERRRIADMNEAIELVDTGFKITQNVTHRNVERSSHSLTFGKEWWIVSTAITPETEDERAAWRSTLDPAYDHESLIGQPAKFAEALARMVTEQLGPQGDGALARSTVGDSPESRSEHPSQWVLHGPVVYADSLHEALSREEDEVSRIASLMFTKSASHVAMREYRFVILRAPDAAEQVRLQISGMMRDALEPTRHGLVRIAPPRAAAGVTEEDREAGPTRRRQWTNLRSVSATSTERVAQRTSREVVAKGIDGQILTSENEQQEDVRERTVIHDLNPEDLPPIFTDAFRSDNSLRSTPKEEKSDHGDPETPSAPDDYASVKDLVTGHAPQPAEADSEGDGSKIHGGAGQIFAQLARMFDDPACPAPHMSEPHAEAALSQDEVHRMYGFVATLGHKVTLVPPESRQDATSACWHAVQCIRNIFVRLGDIVARASIKRDRFVVLELRESEALQASGKVVLAPSGAYAYCFRRTGNGCLGHSEGTLGVLFFPLGNELETFDSFGWHAKEDARTRVPSNA